MMHRPVLCLLTAAALCVPATGALAQQIDSPYRFLDYTQFGGVHAGYLIGNDGRIGIGPQSAPLLGVQWGIRVSGPFSLSVDVGFSPTTRTVRDTVFIAADSVFREVGEADMRLVTAMASLRLNLTGARTWNGIQPFIVAGAGLAADIANAAAVEEDLPTNARFDFGTSFAGQLGAGVDWFPSSRVSLRLDARNMLWKLPVPEAFRLTDAGEGIPGSQWEQNFALAAGLSIHF
jgi:opacity protein-like surface antigen